MPVDPACSLHVGICIKFVLDQVVFSVIYQSESCLPKNSFISVN